MSSNVSGARPRNINPNSREESAGSNHKDCVDEGVNRVLLDIVETLGRTDVVSKTADGCLMSSHVVILPLAKEANNEVSSELTSQDLREEIHVGDKSGLQNDWNVRRIEQLDGIWLLETSHLS